MRTRELYTMKWPIFSDQHRVINDNGPHKYPIYRYNLNFVTFFLYSGTEDDSLTGCDNVSFQLDANDRTDFIINVVNVKVRLGHVL